MSEVFIVTEWEEFSFLEEDNQQLYCISCFAIYFTKQFMWFFLIVCKSGRFRRYYQELISSQWN